MRKYRKLVMAIVGGLVVICVGGGVISLLLPGNEESVPTADSMTVESTIQEEIIPTTVPISTGDPTATDTAAPTKTQSPTATATATIRSTATPTATNTPRPQVNVSTGSANIRSGPGTNYPPVTTAVEGDTLIVLASDAAGDWFNVDLSNGRRGWIAASVVSVATSLESVPIAATIPAPPQPTNTVPAVQVTNTLPPPTQSPAQPTSTLAPTLPPLTPTELPLANCDPAYPTVCIPPPPPDLDCGEISYRRFTVLPPDPHGFDGDNDGIGCES